MRNSTLLSLLSILLVCNFLNANAQSMLNPTDSVITYDSTKKPVQPPYGQIGKWVRTPKVYFNTDQWKCYIYKGVPFRIKFPKTYVPGVADGKKYPMMVFWHGRGEAAEDLYDNEWHLLNGGEMFTKAVTEGYYDGYVIAMQTLLPQSGFFTPGHYQFMKEIIDYMVINNKLDPFRVVDNGLSAGGTASIDMFLAYPTYICAAVACSAPGDFSVASTVDKFKFTPLWYSYGGLDYNPSPYTGNQVAKAMDSAGANFRKFYYPTADHLTWYQTWLNPDFWPMVLKAYSSNPYPLTGKKDFKTTDTLKVTAGMAAGFDAYEWRKDGVLIPGATKNSYIITEEGRYDARVLRGTLWSNWSNIPLDISLTGVTNNIPVTTTPIRIEAEHYIAMKGVQKETTIDSAGGKNVDYIDSGDWMDYSLNVTKAGSYQMNFRIATPANGAQLQVLNSTGTVLNTVAIQSTGGWQTWQSFTTIVPLTAGVQTIRVQSSALPMFNFNWLDLMYLPPSAVPTTPVVATTGTTKIEAENFKLMNGVQSETTSDVGGGKNLGYIDNGDWMDYEINVTTAGSYNINLRVATPATNAQIQVIEGKTVLGSVNLPSSGGWQSWVTVPVTVNLPAGLQTIRIQSSAAGMWNINWLSFVSFASVPTVPPTSGTIHVEAEDFTLMSGVQSETTTDTGGGLNLGYIDNGDWMEYQINPAAAGTFKASFRIASNSFTAQITIKNSTGTVLGTVILPATWGWQTWVTTPTINITLPAGLQTIRLQSSNASMFNINWFELTPVIKPATRMIAPTQPVVIQDQPLSVYPNPGVDRIQLQMNNHRAGTMIIQVLRMDGTVVRQMQAVKQDGLMTTDINISSLPRGSYMIRISMNGWTQTNKILKQ